MYLLSLYTNSARGIALWVAIDEERARFRGGEASSEVYGSRGLSDSALLVGNCDNARHGIPEGSGAGNWTLLDLIANRPG
jgi:hypothetical protein